MDPLKAAQEKYDNMAPPDGPDDPKCVGCGEYLNECDCEDEDE